MRSLNSLEEACEELCGVLCCLQGVLGSVLAGDTPVPESYISLVLWPQAWGHWREYSEEEEGRKSLQGEFALGLVWGALGTAALANKDLTVVRKDVTGVLLALGLVWCALGTAALAN